MKGSSTGLALVGLIAIALLSGCAREEGGAHHHDHGAEEGDLSVNNAWIRASVVGDENGAGYMVIRNRGDEGVQLLSAMSDLARSVELHEHVTVDGRMRMQEVAAVEIPPGEEVLFEPGGLHVMFLGIRQEFEEGEEHTITLEFEERDPLEVTFLVQPVTFRGEAAGSHGDHDH